MKTLAKILLENRQTNGLSVRQLAQNCGIDAALVSKFENGNRLPTEEQVRQLASTLSIPFVEMRKAWLAEKVYLLLEDEEDALEVLSLAESRVEYLVGKQSLQLEDLSPKVKALLAEIDVLKAEWQAKRPLNQTQLRKMKEFFHIEYTYESNRIEGNTLTLQETHLVVNEGITVGGKSLREHLEAINHAEAIQYVEELVGDALDISPRVLLELHYLILKGIDRENAGKYRNVPVRIAGSAHVPPQPYLLGKLMEDYFLHYETQKRIMHPVILAAEMHERLVSIHPFVDGNGRSSRLVMNLILQKHGYTIANLKGDYASRMEYYKALEAVQVNNQPEVFYLLVGNAVKLSLQKHLEMT